MRRNVWTVAVTAFTLTASQVCAQGMAGETRTAQTRAMQWAADTAKVAGGAAFCALDIEIIEEYIAIAQAKIAATANDKVDRVVARIEFGNVYNVASSQEPLGGCENFTKLFPREASKLN